MVQYKKLQQLVDDVAQDVEKFGRGNKAAGTRVRKIMQEIKEQAQEVRKEVLRIRGEDRPPVK